MNIKNKLGRNDPCSCGSGKKYKNCHLLLQPKYEPSNKLQEPILNKEDHETLKRIRNEKKNKTRKKPSSNLLTNGDFISIELRKYIVDKCAEFVDENKYGRSDMCIQYGVLIKYMLKNYANVDSKIMEGKVKYKGKGKDFVWDHVWVETLNGYFIDGNVDSMYENISVPKGINPSSYWGLLTEIPDDREIITKKEMSKQDEIELISDMDEVGKWIITIDKVSKEELYVKLKITE